MNELIREFKGIIDIALETAISQGASYADIRIVNPKSEEFGIKNGIVETSAFGGENGMGMGIRVLVDGTFGFSSITCLGTRKRALKASVRKTTQEAVEIAKTSKQGRSFSIELGDMWQYKRGNFCVSCEIDPFSVSPKDKIEFLLRADAALARGSKKLITRQTSLRSVGIDKIFASQEKGVRRIVEQYTPYTMFEMGTTAKDDNDVQTRSFGFGKNPKPGFEYLSQLNVELEGERLAQEAEELLSASECPSDVMDVIILPDHLGLHVHETGHGLEADRLFGYEQTYVGGTFISDILNQIGSYRFGSEYVNIVADATLRNGFGTFGFDDEGVPAQYVPLVQNGILIDLLTSREIVPQLNRMLGKKYFRSSNGAMRASSFNRMPLIRMTNVSLMPGPNTFEELISKVRRGVVLTGTNSWSMSEDRRNFDFGLQKGILIENGRLTRVVKNPGYTGNNLEFWKNCDGVAGPEEWEILNVSNCGKGQPGQFMFTGHGASPSLFRNITVYNRKGRR